MYVYTSAYLPSTFGIWNEYECMNVLIVLSDIQCNIQQQVERVFIQIIYFYCLIIVVDGSNLRTLEGEDELVNISARSSRDVEQITIRAEWAYTEGIAATASIGDGAANIVMHMRLT